MSISTNKTFNAIQNYTTIVNYILHSYDQQFVTIAFRILKNSGILNSNIFLLEFLLESLRQDKSIFQNMKVRDHGF